MIDIELENAGVNEEQLHLFKKVGLSLNNKVRTDFLNHAERGESLQNQYFVGKVRNRWHFMLTTFLHPNPISISGGEDRIRTCESFRPTRFPDVRLRPLGHLSKCFCARIIAEKFWFWQDVSSKS